jgi:hypothetical protein
MLLWPLLAVLALLILLLLEALGLNVCCEDCRLDRCRWPLTVHRFALPLSLKW